jgi:hypothetical protein
MTSGRRRCKQGLYIELLGRDETRVADAAGTVQNSDDFRVVLKPKIWTLSAETGIQFSSRKWLQHPRGLGVNAQ